MIWLVSLTTLTLIILGVPLGFAIMAGLLLALGIYEPLQLSTIAHRFYDNVNDINLVAIPLLIIAGQLMVAAKVIEPILRMLDMVLGRLRGGMVLVCVGAGLFFAGSTGSSVAESATLASVLSPSLRSRGYAAPFTGALIAATGTLGVLLPPSVTLIIYGILVQYPVGKLWIAGIVPGLLGALLLASMGVLIARKTEVRVDAKRTGSIGRTLILSVPTLVIPVIVFGGIYSGILTISEIAVALVGYVTIYGFLSRSLDWRSFWSALESGGRIAAIIFFVFITARTFSFFVVQQGLAGVPLAFVTSLAMPNWIILVCVNLALLVMGIMMDGLSLLIIATPLIYPIALHVGMSPVQLGVMLAVNIELAVVHPPFGMNLFAVAGVTGTSVGMIARRVVPFIAMLLVLLGLVTFAPLPIFMWSH